MTPEREEDCSLRAATRDCQTRVKSAVRKMPSSVGTRSCQTSGFISRGSSIVALLVLAFERLIHFLQCTESSMLRTSGASTDSFSAVVRNCSSVVGTSGGQTGRNSAAAKNSSSVGTSNASTGQFSAAQRNHSSVGQNGRTMPEQSSRFAAARKVIVALVLGFLSRHHFLRLTESSTRVGTTFEQTRGFPAVEKKVVALVLSCRESSAVGQMLVALVLCLLPRQNFLQCAASSTRRTKDWSTTAFSAATSFVVSGVLEPSKRQHFCQPGKGVVAWVSTRLSSNGSIFSSVQILGAGVLAF